MRISLLLASIAAVKYVRSASSFQLNDAKLQAISSAGIAESSIDFPSPVDDSARVLSLSSTSSLKLSFSTSSSSSVGYASLILSTMSPSSLSHSLSVPTDSFGSNLFRRANAQTSSVSVYLSPKKGGKYRWEWDLTTSSREDIVSLARKGEGRVRAQVMLAPSMSGEEATLLDIGTVQFTDKNYWKNVKATKWPREWEMERYSIREEQGWTFREPRKETGPAKALFGLIAVLAPWIILLSLSSAVLPDLQLSYVPKYFPFFLSLFALEALITLYWFGIIDVWSFMPFVGIASIAALLGGITALGEKMKARLASEGREPLVTMG